MVMILPEGRMKRANGLDSEGKPMTVRGGIADILETIGEGRMLLAYSGGLHHVQIPGDRFPRLFKTIRINLEVVDIGAYRDARMAEAGNPRGFKRAVVDDLERRRDPSAPRRSRRRPEEVLDEGAGLTLGWAEFSISADLLVEIHVRSAHPLLGQYASGLPNQSGLLRGAPLRLVQSLF